jgi:hypothetical protein
MKTVSLMIIFLGCNFIYSSFSTVTAQILVPGMHGISTLPGVTFTWMIISSNHEISLNIRYSGNATTPPVSLSATALVNPKATNGFLNQSSIPRTIGASQVLNPGWSSPSNIVLTFNEPLLSVADLVTIVASPYTSAPQTGSPVTPVPQSGCDPSYPDFCIAPPPPSLNCDNIPQKNFRVLSPDPHGFDKDKDRIGCDE